MSKSEIIQLEKAFEIVDRELAAIRIQDEVVRIRDAANRTLAVNVFSNLDLPPFDKSAMDGYAVIANDHCEEYRVLETVAAGHRCRYTLKPGTATKVMTGAPVPENAGVVIQQEYVSEQDGLIRVLQRSGSTNICKKAEDIKAGQLVLEAGHKLDALDIANVIGCGVGEITAKRPVKIAVISTGDEIVDDPGDLALGKIVNLNGPLLAGLACENGMQLTGEYTVKDDPELLARVLAAALKQADIVLLSGGVSVGEFDFVPQVIEQAGLEIHFSRLAVKPGKPTTFATCDKNILFGLPGNPAAVYLMFQMFVLRAAAVISGGAYEPRQFQLPLADDYRRKSTERANLVPCRISGEGHLNAIEYHGSAHLAALIHADGCFYVPQGIAGIPKGELVRFMALELRGT